MGGPFRRALRVMLWASLAAVLLGSQPLQAWVESHPAWPGAETAAAWHAAMDGIGLAAPYRALRAGIRGLVALPFSEHP